MHGIGKGPVSVVYWYCPSMYAGQWLFAMPSSCLDGDDEGTRDGAAVLELGLREGTDDGTDVVTLKF